MSLPGAEFNDFLFAPIGEDSNGMLVSVLSGLARLDVDSWQEAEKLAQLPGEIATQRLASLIGSYPDPPHDRHALNCVASEQERHQKSITEHAAQHQRND
jgi:hypothetical protein